MKLFIFSCNASKADQWTKKTAIVVGYRFASTVEEAKGHFVDSVFVDYPDREMSAITTLEVPNEALVKYLGVAPITPPPTNEPK